MKKKRKVLATWKVILIVISAIIGLAGIAALYWYLFIYDDTPVQPGDNISFVQDENFVNGRFQVSSDFSLTITTDVEGVTNDGVTLSLDGVVAENGYIDNGIIRVPEKVRLNVPFTVELSQSLNSEIGDLWENGGITTLYAESDYRVSYSTQVQIAVDVSVYDIEAYCYDTGDAEMNPLTNIIVGSSFKVGIDYTPDNSRYMYSDTSDEKRFFFNSLTYNDLDFDAETQTFTARQVSQGNGDTIDIYAFISAKDQDEFLAQNADIIDDFAALNTQALIYFRDNPSAAKTYSISVKVSEVSVADYTISATNFSGYTNEYFHLAVNSASPVFDGNLGAVIEDDEGNILNSIYAGGIGVAYLGSDTTVRVLGSNVLQVIETLANGEYSYQINYQTFDSEASYVPVTTSGDNGETIRTYYFILPDTSSSSSASNYNFRISDTNASTQSFATALFIEDNGQWEIFLTDGQNLATLPRSTVNFVDNAEEEIYWQDASTISLVYDTDGGISDSVDLSDYIYLNSNNRYQTVRYFLMFEHGDAAPEGFNAVATRAGVSYVLNTDININNVPGGANDSGSVYLYELNDSNLTPTGDYDETMYLIFATVRTNADGEIIRDGEKYQIVLASQVKALVIDATLPFNSITPTLTLNSMDADYFLNNGSIYLPSVLNAGDAGVDGDSFTFRIELSDEMTDADFTTLQELFNSGEDLVLEFRSNSQIEDVFTLSNISLEQFAIVGDVSISGDFRNAEGVLFTPYLIYNNGRQVQEKAVSVIYNDTSYNTGFYLYSQTPNAASYAFMSDVNNRQLYYDEVTESVYPINVQVSTGSGVELNWNGNEPDLSALADLITVTIYDQFGREIKNDDVANYTIYEDGTNYILIANNQITGFGATTNTQTATLKVSITSFGSSVETESFEVPDITFNIQSEGISRVSYKENITDTDRIDVTSGNMGEFHITGQLLANDNVNLSSLIEVYVGEGEDAAPVTLNFKLNETELRGYSSEALEDLFGVYGEDGSGMNTGMINLLDGVGDNGNRIRYDADSISSFTIVSPFYVPATLVFDVTDVEGSGIVNIRLEIELLQNVSFSNLLRTYANDKEYTDYLSDNGFENGIPVFAGSTIDLNTYYPISYMSQIGDSDTPLSWGTGGETRLAVSTNDYIEVQGTSLVFSENNVKTFTRVQVTIYYTLDAANGINQYSFQRSETFIINPNYVFVTSNNYIDLSLFSGASAGAQLQLSNYYSLYRATDYIDYYISGNGTQAPNTLSYADISISETSEKEWLALNNSTTNGYTISRNTVAAFDIRLGEDSQDSFDITYTTASDIPELLYSLLFVETVEDGNVIDRNVTLGSTSIVFTVGYGENEQSTIDNIFNYTTGNRNYQLVETSDENMYQLILLESMTYELGTNWTPSAYDGENPPIVFENHEFSVSALSAFNIDTYIKFTNSNNDSITVYVRLTKVGLNFVHYQDKDYSFNEVTGTPEELAENNIFHEMVAGGTYNVVFDEEQGVSQSGFYYRIMRATNTTRTLSIYSVTSGYENLISINNTDKTITIGSLAESDSEVYVVLCLTLSQIRSGNTISYSYYFRIKVLPNYSIGDVTYPYDNNAEYISDNDISSDGNFAIDFEEDLTRFNASTSKVGNTRFAGLELINNGTASESDNIVTYSIYRVRINTADGYETISSSDYATYFEYSFEDGVLNVHLLDRTVSLSIEISKIYDNVQDSERFYTIYVNASPTYQKTVQQTGEAESWTSRVEEDYSAEISTGATYSYTISVSRSTSSSSVTVPVTELCAHLTTENGYNLLKPKALSAGVTVYTNFNLVENEEDGTSEYVLSGEEVLEDAVVITNYTLQPNLFEGREVYSVTYQMENSDVTRFVLAEDIDYFTFESQEGSTSFVLSFETVDFIESDQDFSIGIYTLSSSSTIASENIFNLNFALNGGYNIVLSDNVLSGTPFASGTSYMLDDFVSSITTAEDISDIKETFTYEVLDGDYSNRVWFDETSSAFEVAYSPEAFSVQIKASIDVADGTYSFTFTVNFAASFNTSTTNRLNSSLVLYSQQSHTLNISDTDAVDDVDKEIATHVSSLFADTTAGYLNSEDVSIDFVSTENKEYTITTSNVGEDTSINAVLELSYSFHGEQIFTFEIIYSYLVKPNVALEDYYPAPNGTEFTTEYVTHQFEAEDFFNSAPQFTANESGRITITPQGMDSGETMPGNGYEYSIVITISSISNVTLLASGSTYTTNAEIYNGEMTTANMPDIDMTFNLTNPSASGYVTFSITVNNVVLENDYSVTVSNTNTISIETNAPNRTNGVETIYAEELQGYSTYSVFAEGRVIKYEVLAGTNTDGEYWARFTKDGAGDLMWQIDTSSLGTTVVEDLGGEYAGYAFEGIYTSESATDSAGDPAAIFSILPTITSRIVLRYNGVEVSSSVAPIMLKQATDENFDNMNDISLDDFDSDDVGVQKTYQIAYQYTNETHITSNNYSIVLDTYFTVDADPTTSYQEIEAEQSYQLLSLAGFGIRNKSSGQLFTSDTITEYATINLQIYGLDGLSIIDSGDTLQKQAATIHNTLLKDSSGDYTTGLSPRYGYELKNGLITEGDQSANYLAFQATRDQNQTVIDYTIFAQGATNLGNNVMLRLSYSVEYGSTTITKSANLRFKVMPTYEVEMLTSNSLDGNNYAYAVSQEIDDVNYMTNTSDSPYILSDITSNETQYLWGESSIIRVTSDYISGDNLSSRFTYSYEIRNSGEYNTFSAGVTFRVEEETSSWTEIKEGDTVVGYSNDGQQTFKVNAVELGDKNYYIDAVDGFGYNMRIYFRIQATTNPTVLAKTQLVSEGDEFAIGSMYTEITTTSATLDNVQYSMTDNSATRWYSNALEKSNLGNAPTIITPGVDVELVFIYQENQTWYATTNFDEVPVNISDSDVYYIYYVNDSELEINLGTASAVVEGKLSFDNDAPYSTGTLLYATPDTYEFVYNVTKTDLGTSEPEIIVRDGSGTQTHDIDEIIDVVYVYNLRDSSSGAITQYATAYWNDVNTNATNIYVYINILTSDIYSVEVTQDGNNIEPMRTIGSSQSEPVFNNNPPATFTIYGLDAYAYSTNIVPVYGATYRSNVQDINIAEIYFEQNGVRLVEDEQYYGLNNNKENMIIITAEDLYFYEQEATGSYTVDSSFGDNLNENYLMIPTFSGDLYGTANTMEVTIVIKLKIGTEVTELRQNLIVNRDDIGSLAHTDVYDTYTINSSSFSSNSSEDASSSDAETLVYNDTLEIRMDAGAEIEYAIVKAAEGASPEVPTDNATSSDYVLLENQFNYKSKKYVRISSMEDEVYNVSDLYYIYIKASDEEGFEIYYNDSLLSVDNSTTVSNDGYLRYTIGDLKAFDDTDNAQIKMSIDDISEVQNTDFVTKEIYTIVEKTFTQGTSEGGDTSGDGAGGETTDRPTTYYYKQIESVNVYPLYESLTANDTGSFYLVDNYYQVGSDDSSYYVISANSWASGGTLYKYEAAVSFDTEIANNIGIAQKPYYYTYSITGDAFIDEFGTITTSPNFDLQGERITVTVSMKVSGADGYFDGESGKELGTLQFYLDPNANLETQTTGSLANYTGSTLIVNHSQTIYGSSRLSTPISEPSGSTSDSVYTTLVGQRFNFEDYFASMMDDYEVVTDNGDGTQTTTTHKITNVQFRIVKVGDTTVDRDVGNVGYLDYYTFNTAGQYDCVFIMSFVDRNAGNATITHTAFAAKVIVADTNNSESIDIVVEETPTADTSTDEEIVVNNEDETIDVAKNTDAYVILKEKLSLDNDDKIYELKEDGDVEALSTLTFETQGIYEGQYLVVKKVGDTNEVVVTLYNIKFLVYSNNDTPYNLALAPYSNYQISNFFDYLNADLGLEGNQENTYVLYSYDKITNTLSEVTNFYKQISAGETGKKLPETYYLYCTKADGSVTVEQITINFYLYNSSSTETYYIWTEAGKTNLSGIANNETLCKYDSTNRIMGEINDLSNYTQNYDG